MKSQFSKAIFPEKTLQIALSIFLFAGVSNMQAWGQAVDASTTNTTATNNATSNVTAAGNGGTSINANTGILLNSVQGNHGQQANGAGVAINGDASHSNLNNNQNSNANYLQPVMVSQPNYASSGAGGTAALILPRNPLPLGNAGLGRSNFGLQFGIQNNPGISSITNGKENGLGWFMQGGLTIPFGKIPSVIQNQQLAKMDSLRENQLDNQRRVFGNLNPMDPNNYNARVQGHVVGLNAYNYSTIPSGKITVPVPTPANGNIGEIVIPQPKVLALKPADAFSQPLNTGEQIGVVEVGKEYPYLGHTRSGWVKILLPTGKEAWTSTQFEYVKHDYTEIDTLAVAPVIPKSKTATVITKVQTAYTRDTNVRKRRS